VRDQLSKEMGGNHFTSVCCFVCQTMSNAETVDSRLDMSASSINETLQRHLPWGLPTTDTSTCLLAHEDYVIGYSEDFRLPLWAAYTVTPVTTLSFISFHWC